MRRETFPDFTHPFLFCFTGSDMSGEFGSSVLISLSSRFLLRSETCSNFTLFLSFHGSKFASTLLIGKFNWYFFYLWGRFAGETILKSSWRIIYFLLIVIYLTIRWILWQKFLILCGRLILILLLRSCESRNISLSFLSGWTSCWFF